jgi:hypothetical protein
MYFASRHQFLLGVASPRWVTRISWMTCLPLMNVHSPEGDVRSLPVAAGSLPFAAALEGGWDEGGGEEEEMEGRAVKSEEGGEEDVVRARATEAALCCFAALRRFPFGTEEEAEESESWLISSSRLLPCLSSARKSFPTPWSHLK